MSVQPAEMAKAPPRKPFFKKKKIGKALREQVWIQKVGRNFEAKCTTPWCKNTITVFDFQCGHDIPESKGGATRIENLIPICSRCNLSMSNQYTFEEWKKFGASGPPPVVKPRGLFRRFLCLLLP